MTFISIMMLSYMKSAGASIFAAIPPTLAAARKTYSGFSAAKKPSTSVCLHKSSSACMRVIILLYPCRKSYRTIADPTMPLCPATYILASFSIIFPASYSLVLYLLHTPAHLQTARDGTQYKTHFDLYTAPQDNPSPYPQKSPYRQAGSTDKA